jgi:hypothetical protein
MLGHQYSKEQQLQMNSAKVYIPILYFYGTYCHDKRVFSGNCFKNEMNAYKALLEIAVKEDYIMFDVFVDDHDNEVTKEQFMDYLLAKLLKNENYGENMKNICESDGDSYFNQSWSFKVIESELIE